jgi:alpha-1,3/alpha-1,6-mannosyltransferase
VSARRLRVAFLHPNLGLGGAERWVVDAAMELQGRGHRVTIFTAEHPERAFPETRDGRLDVRVRGAFLPARLGRRLQAPCTVARMFWVALSAALRAEPFDVLVCDVVPYPLPLLGLLTRLRARAGAAPKLVYYCHYPDQMLAPPRHGWYGLYRAPLDGLEVPAMRAADLVLVNSRFTAGMLAGIGGDDAQVVYPGVDVGAYADVPELAGGERSILVVGRFDRRKNLPLAVEALARLRALAPAAYAQVSLVMAGGFDRDLAESGALAEELGALAGRLGVADKLVLRRSPSDEERHALLGQALCVVHCAVDEHFGLVPVEAMAAARPVVAVANAGPLETVVHGETGLLCAPTPDAFAGALATLITDRGQAARMGRNARAHATARFSRRAFGDALEAALGGLVGAEAGG